MSGNKIVQQITLKDIRASLKQIDEARQKEALPQEQIQLLELSAVALRDAERLSIAYLQESLAENMEQRTMLLNAMAKQIRTRVTKMNKVPKSLGKIEKIMTEAVRLLTLVGKWKV